MFEKSLSDMVKGIRAHKKDEAKYTANCIRECLDELTKQNDMGIKAEALLKLTYLQMHGHPMTGAAFNCVEAMSSPIFRAKRLGYLAASQTFAPDTDVVLLATNLIKKDMSSPNTYEASLALNALANIVTPDLSRDLVADVVAKLASPTPYVRKRGVLLLYKCILKYPQALRPAFPKLKEKLSDSDPSVVGTAVNVICELARKNPKNFLSLAPTFYSILTTTSNNWMLIKITKLFGSLTPLEPRLGKKLVTPLTNILKTTQAKSLQYEVVSTVSLGMTQHDSIVELGMQKLQGFLEDHDQNLKYLALLCMGRFIVTHPALVATHQATIVRCLSDVDETIRTRALDLVAGMVSARNLRDVVKLLLAKAAKSEGEFVQRVVEKVIAVCSMDGYVYLKTQEDFQWYITTLGVIARLKGVSRGEKIAAQIIDVPLRVADVRSFAAQAMVELLRDADRVMEGRLAQDPCGASIISAASWVVGEYCDRLQQDASSIDYPGLVVALLHPTVRDLPVDQQPIYLHTLLKVCAKAAGSGQANLPVSLESRAADASSTSDPAPADDAAIELARAAQEARLTKLSTEPGSEPEPEPELEADAPEPTKGLAAMILEAVRPFMESTDAEVQERACFGVNLLEAYDVAAEGTLLAAMFEDDLKPVGRAAQKKIAEDCEIDLDSAIFTESDLEPEEADDDTFDLWGARSSSSSSKKKRHGSSRAAKAAEDEEAYRREHKDGAFYLGGGGNASSPSRVEDIVEKEKGETATGESVEEDGDLFALDDKFTKKRKGKRSHRHDAAGAEADAKERSVSVLRLADDEEEAAAAAQPGKTVDALSVQNLDNIGADEVLPEIKAYERATARYSGLGSALGGGADAGMDWMAEAAREKKRKHKSKKGKDKDKEKEKKKKSSKEKKSGHKKSGKERHKQRSDSEQIPDVETAAAGPGAAVEAWAGDAAPTAAEPAAATGDAPTEKVKKKKSKAKE